MADAQQQPTTNPSGATAPPGQPATPTPAQPPSTNATSSWLSNVWVLALAPAVGYLFMFAYEVARTDPGTMAEVSGTHQSDAIYLHITCHAVMPFRSRTSQRQYLFEKFSRGDWQRVTPASGTSGKSSSMATANTRFPS